MTSDTMNNRERAITYFNNNLDKISDEKLDDAIRLAFEITPRPKGHEAYGWLLPENKEETKFLTSIEFLKAALPYAQQKNINLFYEPLNKAFIEFKVNNGRRICAFLAQIAHESGSLKFHEEIASGEAYEGRKDLGNINKGDGKRYKGRGIIQLTGRSNYAWASEKLGIDLINSPNQAKLPEVSTRIAGLYWQSRGLNELADIDTINSFKLITKRINGGLNGWSDRVKHWTTVKRVLSQYNLLMYSNSL